MDPWSEARTSFGRTHTSVPGETTPLFVPNPSAHRRGPTGDSIISFLLSYIQEDFMCS
jgi:hypothetical protein